MPVIIMGKHFTVKIVSVDENTISGWTKLFLDGLEDYRDTNTLGEDLFSPYTVMEEFEGTPQPDVKNYKIVEAEIKYIFNQCGELNASYFRLVNP